MIKSAVTIALLLAGAPSWAACNWTNERAVAREIYKDPLFSEGPIVQQQGCKTGEPPICVGYAVCSQEREDPDRITTVACASVPDGSGWKCPSADDCSNDAKITVIKMSKLPVPAAAAPATPPAATPPAATTN